MALAAALTVLMAVLPAGLAAKNNSNSLKVTCVGEGSADPQTVTAPGTVLTVVCPKSWTIFPSADKEQKVCDTAACANQVPLTNYSAQAEAVAPSDAGPGIKITFNKLPQAGGTFYLDCREDQDGKKKCDVKVTVDKPSAGPSDEVPRPPSGSGAPGVQTCKQNASITLKIPEKGSSAQFACESGFDLYPKEADKVFSKDCKTKEALSDMKRTEAPAAETVTGPRSEETKTYTYTLTADKKPSKKTLCYLCAKHDITGRLPGTAKDYCTIYVESAARTQLNLIFTFILALPCVLAAFQFT